MELFEVAQYFERRASEVLATIESLVRIEAPTGDKEGVGNFASHYRGLLESAGAVCRSIEGPSGPHLIGRFGKVEDRGAILLVGHLDTVWPLGEVERRPPERKDGRLYGPGTYDMRAGLALIVHALEFFRAQSIDLGTGVTVFVSADEERGSPTAHPHLDELLGETRAALVAEPPLKDGALKAERRGVAMYTLEVLGCEAHAGGEPERGINAIVALMKLAIEVASWARPERGLLVNVGQVSGGTATNVVPGRATAGIDVRFDDPADAGAFEERLRALAAEMPEAKCIVRGGTLFPPLIDRPEARALRQRVQAIGRSLGLSIGEGKSGGGSDGSYLASKGVPVVDGMGVDGDGAHALHEHVVIDRIAPRAALLAGAILELASDVG